MQEHLMADDPINTGLAGLTVTVTPEAAPEPVVTVKDYVPSPPHECKSATGGDRCDVCFGPVAALAPYPKAPLPVGWTLPKVACLVHDVAIQMYDLPDILKKYGLSPEQYATLETNEFFEKSLKQFTIDWHSATNTPRRLALEAAMSIEHVLPDIVGRATKPNEDLSAVVSLLKVLSEIAGVTGAKAQQAQQAPTEKFNIVINLGADHTLQREANVPIQNISRGEKETAPGGFPEIQHLLEGATETLRVAPVGTRRGEP